MSTHQPDSTRDRQAAFLNASVNGETRRLERQLGRENAPFGGWRNTALATVAERERMNPYALDRLIRNLPS